MMKMQRKACVLALTLTLALGCISLPARAASSCDAVVTASSLNLRSGAGSGYTLLAVAPRGATLTIIGMATEDENWFKVNYNGTEGYMDGTYLSSASSSAAADAIATAAAEAAAGTAAPTAVTETPAATETATATETPAATTDPNDPAWLILTPSGDANATVTGELVRFRSTPGGDIIGNFSNGARVWVASSSGSWYQVNCNGTAGYVHSSYVSLDVDSSAATPTATAAASTPAAAVNSTGGQQIVDTAMQYQGVPYVWGGTSPSGFDCSGLCYYVYQQCGYSIERVAQAIYTGSGYSVSYDQLQAGDIICFGNSSYVWHVGIYIGGGQFIHAPYSGAVVRVESLSGTYINNFVCGKRIV